MFELFSKVVKYGFVFLIYYFLFNFLKIMVADLKNEKSSPKATGFILSNDEEGKSYSLLDINTIGRAEDADIIINDPFISSKHALIIKKGSKILLQDLNSKNGSFLNGKKVKRPVRLKENDEILLGTKRLTFLRGENVGTKNPSYLQ